MGRWHGILAACLAAAVFASCSEPTDEGPVMERYVYVPVSDSTGAVRDPGLYRIAVSSGTVQRIDARQVCRTSGVAENGIVLFRVGTGGPCTGAAQALYGRCEDGSIIPVPFPVSPDPGFEYGYAIPPEVALAARGHHAVYPVLYRAAGSTRDADARLRLVLFNCAKGEMTVIDAHGFALQAMAAAGVTHARAAEGELAIAGDGSAVYFVIEGRRDSSGVSVPVVWALAEWKTGALRLVDSLRAEPERLLGYCEALRSVILDRGGAHYAHSTLLPPAFAIPSAAGLEQRRFSAALGVFAAWGDEGVELRNPWTGAVVERVYSYEAIRANFGDYAYAGDDPLTISADGAWLVFALRRGASSPLRDVIAVARDHSQAKRLMENVAAGAPVISNPLQGK